MRPIDEVIEEVAGSKWRLFWGIDDNIWGVNFNYTLELYREMSRTVRGKWWFGQGDLVSLEHPRSDDMLKYARGAGLTSVLVGWESNNLKTLDEYKATSKQGRSRRDAIQRIRDNGIDVMLFIMVGGRQDLLADYDGVRKLCDELKVAAHPVMTTPFPGTSLYDMYQPYLIPGLDWDCYDGNHAVFEHDSPDMSVKVREDELIRLRADLLPVPEILKRLTRISLKGFPMSHISSWMIQYPLGRAYREFAEEHAKELARSKQG